MGGSWTDKSKRTGKTYGRKPYIKGKTGSYSEMMDTTPRKAMLDQRLEKKSQYDKPYLVDDYAEMEHIQPPPPGILTFEDPEKRKRQRRPVPTGEDLPPPGTWTCVDCGVKNAK